MKKIIIFVLIALAFLFLKSNETLAAFGTITGETQAIVLEALDGRTLRVRPLGGSRDALIVLAGIETEGISGTREFLINQLLGHTVDVIPSDFQPNSGGRFVMAYVHRNGVVYNRALVIRGLAVVDEAYSGGWMYHLLVQDEEYAQINNLGAWRDEGFRTIRATRPRRPGEGVWDRLININLASISQINNILRNDFDYNENSLLQPDATQIINMRLRRPFRSVGELAYARVFSRATLDEFQTRFVVSTNINNASREELMEIEQLSGAMADAIITQRNREAFTDARQLVELGLMPLWMWERAAPFISVENISVLEPEISFDINTATRDELIIAGFTPSQANLLFFHKINGYNIKHLGELTHMQGLAFPEDRIWTLEAKLHTPRPGLGGFININFASHEELRNLGLSVSEINAIAALRRSMRSASDIPINVSRIDSQITLFTNVNNTTPRELMSLGLDEAFSELLAREGARLPFASREQLAAFFNANGRTSAFNNIRDFLIIL